MRTDPFGLAPRQHDLFGAPEPVLDAPMTADDIRRELERTLATLREADAMPWTTRHMLEVVVMFPDLARRLPGEEAERLIAEFQAEMRRLRGVR